MGLASKLAAAEAQEQQQPTGQQQAPPAQAQQGQQQMYPNQGYPPPGPPGGQYGQYPPPQHPPQGYPPQGHYPPPQHPPQGHYPPPQQGYPMQYGGQGQRGMQPGVPPPYPPPQQQQPPANYLQILQQCVQENGLQPFYPPQRLQQLASTIGPQVQQISQAWKIPVALANDLVKLSLYDIVLFCDDSGSMSFEENGERIDDLRLIMQRVSYAASLFDTNGIEVRFMNGKQMGNNIRSDQQVGQLMSQTRFNGLTPLGTSLKSKIIDPMVIGPAKSGQLQKPVLVITVTDGHPAGESSNTIFKVIKETKSQVKHSRYGPGAVSFQFAQVGNDMKARDFLAKLDSDREVGAMVDCTSTYEVEQDEMARLGVTLTPTTWLVKLMMGAIDHSYDKQDEGRR